MTDVRDVKCGRDKVALKGPTDAKPQDRFTCPICGEGDTFENIMREVRDYAEEQMAQHFEKQMAGMASGSKILTFTPAIRPKRAYRFIVDLDLH